MPILLIPLYSSQKPRLLEGLLCTQSHNFPTWEDVAFKRVWWIALGWAAAEAVFGIKQGYENLALYKDVVVSVRKSVVEPDEANHAEPGAAHDEAMGTSRDGILAASTPNVVKRPLAEGDIQNEFSRRRNHSDSLSSNASVAAYEDLSASIIREERRQLLPSAIPTDSLPLAKSDRILVENEVERDLEELIRLKSREDLEDMYGMPFIVCFFFSLLST